MHISFNKLRDIKHKLPTGSVKRIATELQIEEQTVRNYFGAQKYEDGKIVGKHVQPGPEGGFVEIEDDTILNAAKRIIDQEMHRSSDN